MPLDGLAIRPDMPEVLYRDLHGRRSCHSIATVCACDVPRNQMDVPPVNDGVRRFAEST